MNKEKSNWKEEKEKGREAVVGRRKIGDNLAHGQKQGQDEFLYTT